MGKQIASPAERFQMSAAYRLNVVSTARAELFECRTAFAVAEAAAYDSLGLVVSTAALQDFAKASDALADAVNQFKAAWAFASGR